MASVNSTREQLHTIADKMLKDRPLKRMSVAALAKAARVSRSAVYRYYPDVVEKLRSTDGGSKKRKRDSLLLKIQLMRQRVKDLQLLNAALVKACAEFLAERNDERELMADQRKAFELRIAFLEAKLKGRSNVIPIASSSGASGPRK